jgi:transposase
MMTMTRTTESTAPTITSSANLLLAFELGERVWKLGFATAVGQRPRIRQIGAGAMDRLIEEIGRAKVQLQLPAEAPVISCYEAGREGFWLHRYLVAQGITNYVVDSSSIEVNRRARRAKTDRLDLGGLLSLLLRYVGGDQRVWHVVRVPTMSEEDARHVHRARETIQQDRNRLINRIKGLLTTQGLQLSVNRDFLSRIDAVHRWDGTPLPVGIKERLARVWAQLDFLNAQLKELKDARAALKTDPHTAAGRTVEQLQTLCGVGSIGAWLLTTEIFGWRQIRNGRELGALVGLVPAPYQSGDTSHDRGIARAGNRHVRRMMVQLAWSWLRYQPASALSRWYQQRFGRGRRMRRIGIVALARKLLIALWRYLETGAVPDGAVMKPHVV